MIRVWLIAGIALLTGCESEFERCMATELPRAEAESGLAGEQEAEAAFERLKPHLERGLKIIQVMQHWFKENPRPLGKDIGSETLTAFIEAENRRRFEVARSLGSHAASVKEFVAAEEEAWDLFEQFVEPRSLTAKCKVSANYYPECKGIESIFEDADLNSDAGIDRFEELDASARIMALSEAMSANDEALKRLAAKGTDITEAAIEACNRNGIYE